MLTLELAALRVECQQHTLPRSDRRPATAQGDDVGQDSIHAPTASSFVGTGVVTPVMVQPAVPVFTKEKPGCWTRQRAFAQVRHDSNIQLLSFSLVTTQANEAARAGTRSRCLPADA
jgi:hypothetical protein